jgi:hypothetical protein
MNDDASGHRTRLARFFSFFAPALLVLVLSFAIAWPLWALATKERRTFTIGTLILIALVLVFFVARALLARIARRRS